MPTDKKLSADEIALARKRRLVAMRLQEIEGNPLDAEDVAMFEMFEREGWSHERRRGFLRDGLSLPERVADAAS